MSIGPIQLIVLGFNHPDFQGEVIEELESLRQNDMVDKALEKHIKKLLPYG